MRGGGECSDGSLNDKGAQFLCDLERWEGKISLDKEELEVFRVHSQGCVVRCGRGSESLPLHPLTAALARPAGRMLTGLGAGLSRLASLPEACGWGSLLRIRVTREGPAQAAAEKELKLSWRPPAGARGERGGGGLGRTS